MHGSGIIQWIDGRKYVGVPIRAKLISNIKTIGNTGTGSSHGVTDVAT